MKDINVPRPRSNFFLHSKKAKAARAKQALKNEMVKNGKGVSLKNNPNVKTSATIPPAIKDFARIKKMVDNAPDLDNSAKIASLKQKMENGTYKVDYEALADKILQSEF
ncbi:MAG: flagellar biosynthesis anti-sigma factor FlgM [Halobacteriovoraceae bacterium]|nr:flagellar biosynthesis anti-sigma factor FlgM [Halobacteriovoraceae bacterium]